MSPEQRYLWWFFGSVALLLGAVGALNVAVDPYSVFGSPRIEGFNANKPGFVEQLRLTHVYAVERRTPRCILLGTSRTGKGLDPDHPALSGLGCYNMALPSISLYEMRRYFQHAEAVTPQQRAILALDFRVFGTPPDTTGAFAEARLAVDADNRPQFNLFSAKLPDLARAMFSTTAIRSSIRTVRRQAWTRDSLAANGHWTTLNPRYDHGAAFAAFTRNTLGRYADLHERDAVFQESRQELRALLRAAYASEAEVSLLISPSHAWHWQAMELSGMWARFEAIKRDVVQVNEEEAFRASRSAFPVWDFSGAYGPNVEPVPTSANVGMRWYWESVHYKRELGDLMSNRMLGTTTSPEWPDFGVRLTSNNLELHLAHLRDLQRTYAEEHPDVVARIRALM